MKTLIAVGGSILIGGITYLISFKSSEKEREYFEIKNGQSTQTIQLFGALTRKSQELCVDLFNQSIPLISQCFVLEITTKELNKQQKMYQIQCIVEKKISEWFARSISSALISLSTHLGIVLNKRDSILQETSIQTIITEPSKRVKEYCETIFLLVQSLHMNAFAKVKEINLNDLLKTLQQNLLIEMISFIQKSIKKRIETKDQEALLDDLHIDSFVKILIKYHTTQLNNILLKQKETITNDLLICQFVTKCNVIIQTLPITPEFFMCDEMNQKLFEFFQ
ncbi:hypothetical protein EDI_008970 [Entamoeba dispar SAW760]|uniref:Uncharacterized protein n=1 Tax=Entamoeba dispar (strain ATCC PRA-260 / SAW760) TaxID=370354 RepID=B0E929_ENTDS|nr:uncharacterized protein EDI_008970 [Entamoeba dispar SAW760]EDR28963.1 hypothetical protein EDI_008970 [Entamoeba dispar SAW760]|eukprot:EDR28963.1 hypothetical protein EDI_008970 [Entamoeba dispar SAW760]